MDRSVRIPCARPPAVALTFAVDDELRIGEADASDLLTPSFGPHSYRNAMYVLSGFTPDDVAPLYGALRCGLYEGLADEEWELLRLQAEALFPERSGRAPGPIDTTFGAGIVDILREAASTTSLEEFAGFLNERFPPWSLEGVLSESLAEDEVVVRALVVGAFVQWVASSPSKSEAAGPWLRVRW